MTEVRNQRLLLKSALDVHQKNPSESIHEEDISFITHIVYCMHSHLNSASARRGESHSMCKGYTMRCDKRGISTHFIYIYVLKLAAFTPQGTHFYFCFKSCQCHTSRRDLHISNTLIRSTNDFLGGSGTVWSCNEGRDSVGCVGSEQALWRALTVPHGNILHSVSGWFDSQSPGFSTERVSQLCLQVQSRHASPVSAAYSRNLTNSVCSLHRCTQRQKTPHVIIPCVL